MKRIILTITILFPTASGYCLQFQDFIPIKIGSIFYYEVRAKNGTMYKTVTLLDIQRIENEFLIGYKDENIINYISVVNILAYCLKSDSLVSVYSKNLLTQNISYTEHVILKMPSLDGVTKWQHIAIPGKEIYQYSAKLIKKVFEGKESDCIEVTKDVYLNGSLFVKNILYYVRGIGLTEERTFNENGKEQGVYRILVKYEIPD